MTGQGALLIVGGTMRTDGQGQRVIEQAKKRELRVIVADHPAALTENAEIIERADETVAIDRKDIVGTTQWVRQFHREKGLVGVYGYRDYAMCAVASAAEAVCLPGNSLQAIRRIRDKHACREHLRWHGFQQPRGHACAQLADAAKFIHTESRGPWVIKPRDDRGSRGVTLINRPDDLAQAFARLPDPHRSRFMVEEYQPGAEYSAEGVFIHGKPHVLAITEKHLMPESTVELGHVMPAPLRPPLPRRIATTVCDALIALKLRFGVFHVELWVDGDNIVLGEVHNRPGGDFINRMVELVAEVELHGLVFDDLLGLTPQLPGQLPVLQPDQVMAVCYATPPPGTVLASPDIEAVLSDPHCVDADTSVAAGDLVAPILESADRPGCTVAAAPDARLAWQKAQELTARLGIHTSGLPYSRSTT